MLEVTWVRSHRAAVGPGFLLWLIIKTGGPWAEGNRRGCCHGSSQLTATTLLPSTAFSHIVSNLTLTIQLLLCSSVAKSRLTFCDPMHCSMPGSSILHHLPLCSISCPLSRWCYLTISSSVIPFSFCLQSFPASGSFPMSRLFKSGGQSIGASASATVLLL